MAGGLFGRPFVLNAKCIVFSLIIMMLFMIKPNFKSNIVLYVTLFIIFVLSYVAMAWYDYFYDCRLLPLKRGKYSFTGLFKPPAHQPEKQYQHDDHSHDTNTKENKRHHMFVYVTHIIIFVPILVYVAYYKGNAGAVAFSTLVVLGILTAAYHAMRLLSLIHTSPSALILSIYLTHLLVISPILAYVGIMKNKAKKLAFNSLYVIAALAFIYHGKNMI